jgi:hypothetical protein
VRFPEWGYKKHYVNQLFQEMMSLLLPPPTLL